MITRRLYFSNERGGPAGLLFPPMLRPVFLLATLGLATAAEPRPPADAARVAAVTAHVAEFTHPEPFEANAGGAFSATRGALSAGLSPADRMQATLGEALFQKLWVAAPSATRASDGLGPVFNARACAGCHPSGGRGGIAGAGQFGFVVKLSRPADPNEIEAGLAAIAGWHPTTGDPALGRQLNDRAVPGIASEGEVELLWRETGVPLAREAVRLRRPVLRLIGARLAEDVIPDLRVAPHMTGLGLLEAIPAEDILSGADPDDSDGDGVSGRASVAWSRLRAQPMLGRFGHKAGAATLEDMTASALFHDLGLSSPSYPAPEGDCTRAACARLPHGEDAGLRDEREVSSEAVRALAAYAGALAGPLRRDFGAPEVLRGKAAFAEAGCTACHRPKFVTARLPDRPDRSFQLIWPYSDLLLHDMGPELASAPEGVAEAAEWRTAPLWGIGGQSSFLHDGRARSLHEAILWHGGETAPSRDRFVEMPPETRANLIRFLESL